MEPSAEPDHAMRYRSAALALIVAVTIARVVYLAWFCPFDLAPDEAHYWDWSRHLDWSYYSKGPLVAWLIRLSCELFLPLLGNEVLAVRLPAIGCGSGLLVGLYVLTVQVHGSDRLALGVVALALTWPIITAGATLMTIDAPFTCCWMWALVLAHRAVFRSAWWAWPAAGGCILLGVLAKYTMVLWVPSFTLFLLTTPTMRPHLRRPGFWILVGVGALGGIPILAWNACNGWVTLEHTRSHAGLEEDGSIRWFGPIVYVGVQFGVLLGFWFLAWVRAAWAHRTTREARPEWRFLWWMSMPTFAFFGLFSWKNGGGEANWPLAGYLAGMILAAGWMTNEWRHPSAGRRHLCRGGVAGFAMLGMLITCALHHPLPLQPMLLRIAGPATAQRPTPIRRIDPTTRLRGWRTLASEVDRARADLRARGIEPLLAAERWTQASELGFYCQGHPTVYCLGIPLGDRQSQCDLWRPNPIADPSMFRGRSFLLICPEPQRFRHAFDRLESTHAIAYRESGSLVAEWTLTIAHGYQGIGTGLAPE